MGGRSALLKRLPFLAVAALGIYLWQSDLFPQDRELVWRLPVDAPPLQRLEIQIWSGETLLKREEFFPGGAVSEIKQTLPLRRGTYRVEAFAYVLRQDRAAAVEATPEQWTTTLEVRGDQSYGEVLGRRR